MENLGQSGTAIPTSIAIRSDGLIRASDPETTLLYFVGDSWVPMRPMPTGELKHFDGFVFTLLGTVTGLSETTRAGSYWIFTLDTRTVALKIERMSAWRPGGYARAQIEWDEASGRIVKVLRLTEGIEHLRLPEQDRAIKDATRAWRAIEAFAPAAGGNPGYFSGPDDPRVFVELGKAAHAAMRAGERIGYASLARYGLAADWRTVKGYVANYDLKAIETEAARCTSGVSTCRFVVRHAAEYLKNRG